MYLEAVMRRMGLVGGLMERIMWCVKTAEVSFLVNSEHVGLVVATRGLRPGRLSSP